MKTKLILILLLLTSIRFYSQKYIPLVIENRDWSTLIVNTIDWPFDTTYYTVYHKFDEDTSIGEFQYLKVFETQNKDMSNWVLKGCIREDTERKVWYKPIGIEDRIKYNFGMQVGETITIENYPELTLDSIKSISINGIFRNHFYLSNEFASEIWIEGIGSLLGLLNSGQAGIVGGYSKLLCMYENEQLIWQNPNYEECWLISEIEILNEDNINVNLFSNFNNYIKIENNEPFEITVEIYDLLGKQIVIQRIKKNEDVYLNINHFQKGIYICKIITGQKKIKTQKFIY